MSGSDWQRARSPEQIEERHNAILEAAAAVFQEHAFEDVTLQMIARRAGFTRTNLYRYYKTREEIFLALLMEDMDALTREAENSFTAPLSAEDFIDTWADAVINHQRLLELTPYLALSLEKNSSEEVYRQTKIKIAEISTRMGAAIKKAQPQLSPEQIYQILQLHLVLSAGGWPLSCASEDQQRILKELGLEYMKMDFKVFYRSSLHTFLKGLSRD